MIERKQKACAFAISNRASKRTFKISALFGRLDSSKGVACIEYRIAKHEIQRAVKGGCSTLGNNLQPRPAWAGKPSRIRILVDLHFFHRRRRHPRPVRLKAVDHQGDPVCAGGAVVEKPGHRGDVILIKYGHTVEGVAVDRIRTLILASLGADNRCLFRSDIYGLVLHCNRHHHAQIRDQPGPDNSVGFRFLKSRSLYVDRVSADGYVVESKHPRIVR